MASVHEGNKPFQCNVCNASFTRKQGLKIHINSIHEKKEPYKCSICDTSFTRRQGLKEHIDSIHEKIKPYKCNICDTHIKFIHCCSYEISDNILEYKIHPNCYSNLHVLAGSLFHSITLLIETGEQILQRIFFFDK